jgi:hypothetical protein
MVSTNFGSGANTTRYLCSKAAGQAEVMNAIGRRQAECLLRRDQEACRSNVGRRDDQEG